jgi:hypothetical protein
VAADFPGAIPTCVGATEPFCALACAGDGDCPCDLQCVAAEGGSFCGLPVTKGDTGGG